MPGRAEKDNAFPGKMEQETNFALAIGVICSPMACTDTRPGTSTARGFVKQRQALNFGRRRSEFLTQRTARKYDYIALEIALGAHALCGLIARITR